VPIFFDAHARLFYPLPPSEIAGDMLARSISSESLRNAVTLGPRPPRYTITGMIDYYRNDSL